jgi:hypothetical protein
MREAINEGKEIRAQDEAEPEEEVVPIEEEEKTEIVKEAVVEGEKEEIKSKEA